MKVIFSNEFSQALEYYFRYLDEQGKYEGNRDLALDFVKDVVKAVDQIEANPEAWRSTTRNIRRIHLAKFKHHVIRYRYNKNKNLLTIVKITMTPSPSF